MILTEEDFDIPPYNIPNLNKVKNTFKVYRDRKEEEVLRFLLGDDLYDAFKLGIDGIEEVDIEQRWKDLRDGVNYSYVGKRYRYTGLKALLTPWFYASWVEDHWKPFSGIGVVTPKGENATVKYPLKNIMNAWNEFCFMAGTSLVPHYRYFRKSGPGSLQGYLRSTDVYDDTLYEMDINTYLRAFCHLPEFRTWL